jgi:hypothetical protein
MSEWSEVAKEDGLEKADAGYEKREDSQRSLRKR